MAKSPFLLPDSVNWPSQTIPTYTRCLYSLETYWCYRGRHPSPRFGFVVLGIAQSYRRFCPFLRHARKRHSTEVNWPNGPSRANEPQKKIATLTCTCNTINTSTPTNCRGCKCTTPTWVYDRGGNYSCLQNTCTHKHSPERLHELLPLPLSKGLCVCALLGLEQKERQTPTAFSKAAQHSFSLSYESTGREMHPFLSSKKRSWIPKSVTILSYQPSNLPLISPSAPLMAAARGSPEIRSQLCPHQTFKEFLLSCGPGTATITPTALHADT